MEYPHKIESEIEAYKEIVSALGDVYELTPKQVNQACNELETYMQKNGEVDVSLLAFVYRNIGKPMTEFLNKPRDVISKSELERSDATIEEVLAEN